MKLTPNPSTRIKRPDEITDVEYYILGGGDVGRAVATRLRADGYATAIVDESYDSAELPGMRGDPTDIRILDEVGLSETSTVIVATRSDKQNLLIAQLVSAYFGISRILVLATVPERSELIAEAGHKPICVTAALSDAFAANL